MAKAAIHQLVQSLAESGSGLPEGALVAAILPVTLVISSNNVLITSLGLCHPSVDKNFLNLKGPFFRLYLTTTKSFKKTLVYNCCFAETGQATTYQRDVIFLAVKKIRAWVTAGSFPV